MSDSVGAVIDYWRRAGIAVNDGASEEQLRALEARLGVPLASDVAAFFRAANGMPQFATDEYLLSIWSVERVLAENLARDGVDAHGPYWELAFGDVSIDAWHVWLRVRADRSLRVFVESDQAEEPSLAAFFGRYLSNPASMYL